MSDLPAIFLLVSQTLSLPPGLLSAICFVESSHRPDIINHHDGDSESLGLCQVKLTTAQELGFIGQRSDLLKPSINAYYAGRYLKKQLDRYDGSTYKAVCAYNAGTYRPKTNDRYARKVLRLWQEGK